MRILLDKNVPRGVRRILISHTVETVDAGGWSTLKNGELLKAAEIAQFDVLVTADQNIIYQQNRGSQRVSLVVLNTHNWAVIKEQLSKIATAVNAAKSANYTLVEFERQRPRRFRD